MSTLRSPAAGARDRQITIQRSTPTTAASGQQVDAWATLAIVWAEKRDIRGKTFFGASQEIAERATTFRTGWLAGLSDVTSLRVLYDGLTYRVDGVAELGRRAGVDIMCTAQGA